MPTTIPNVRFSPDNRTVIENLGLIGGLAGTWQGKGFNLIARPDFQGDAPLYLQLNQTNETLTAHPIGSPIPNRGFGQDDMQLFGLTYLDQISDAPTGGALHIEPGIWVTQPETAYPDELPPPGGQIIARMASIPHGNSLLAQGAATPITSPPVLPSPTEEYAFSAFPSFNSTPFAIPAGGGAPQINAAGSSEALTAPALAHPAPPFTEYDLTVPASAANPRTPFGSSPTEPALPATIDGVAMQDVINDPITLLQAVVQRQVADGYSFSGSALNVATQPSITFLSKPNDPTGASTQVTVTDGAGGIENIQFLEGVEPPAAGAQGPNALTSLVYATFWIERVTHPDPDRVDFLQLQYAQMTVLNFGILNAPGAPILGWPHISVGTLRKSFH
jgi:hypothetical protein